MAEPKVIAVVGATGAQGGGLVRAISADSGGGFVARAITRDPESHGAKALAALPNVEAAVLPAGKLAVHEEFPDEVADAIRSFLIS